MRSPSPPPSSRQSWRIQPPPGTATGSLSLFRYDPPPPPPLPPPLGSGLLERARPAPIRPGRAGGGDRSAAPRDDRSAHARDPRASRRPTRRAARPPAVSPALPRGMEGGVERGMVGGVPGGVVDGAIGGRARARSCLSSTTTRASRPYGKPGPTIRTRAFTKKIEGVVVVEIPHRRHRTRGPHAHPPVGAAARRRRSRRRARQWLFRPAVRHGRPVATIAVVPVRFTIY